MICSVVLVWLIYLSKCCRSWQGSNLRGQSPLDFKSNALTTRPQLLGQRGSMKKHVRQKEWRCGGSNPGPFTCKANALPLSYIPYVGNECTICRNIEEDLFGTRIYQPAKNICTHGGTRTPNLRFRRPTPYPLGHAGILERLSSLKFTDIKYLPNFLQKTLRRPGIEPGSQEWESCMIPLHQRRCV